MNITAQLTEKSFVNEKNEAIKYYVISIALIDGSVLELAIKGDKAKLLLMSEKLKQSNK